MRTGKTQRFAEIDVLLLFLPVLHHQHWWFWLLLFAFVRGCSLEIVGIAVKIAVIWEVLNATGHALQAVGKDVLFNKHSRHMKLK